MPSFLNHFPLVPKHLGETNFELSHSSSGQVSGTWALCIRSGNGGKGDEAGSNLGDSYPYYLLQSEELSRRANETTESEIQNQWAGEEVVTDPNVTVDQTPNKAEASFASLHAKVWQLWRIMN